MVAGLTHDSQLLVDSLTMLSLLLYPLLSTGSTVQPKKARNRPDMTEQLLTGM